MSSKENQSTWASQDGENHPRYWVKPRKNQLARSCAYSLFIGLLLLGIFLLKLTGPAVNIQFKNAVSEFWPRPPHHHPGKPRYGEPPHRKPHDSEQCPQVGPLSPKHTTDELDEMDEYFLSGVYEISSAAMLSKAVQFPTVSYDNMTDPELSLYDPLYRPFDDFFENYVSVEFLFIAETLHLDHVNIYGLLYTWAGTDPSLKPTLLLAHQDVVPVEESSMDDWLYEPWSGEIAEGKVWGRGSSDTKHTLVGILEAVEALIAAEFKPTRTLLLSFGFDEEIGGRKGAANLANQIAERYEDGVAVIVDEGSTQITQWGRDILVIGVSEKGQLPTNIEIRTPGRHVSVPVEHTGIGIMSEIVTSIEDHHYNTYFGENHPMLEFLTCTQKYADDFPAVLKPLLKNRLAGEIPPDNKDRLAVEFVKNAGLLQDQVKWGLTTAKSVNIIQGGIKVNALPEHVIASTDIRIHIAENTQLIRRDVSEIVYRVAENHNLTVSDFDDFDASEDELPVNSIRVWANRSFEPAHISPFTVNPNVATPWSILAGTSKSVIDPDLIVSPGVSAGNTDTKNYQGISKYVYRYSPGGSFVDSIGIHTVNEAMSVTRHVTGVRWYSTFIRNMDEARFEDDSS